VTDLYVRELDTTLNRENKLADPSERLINAPFLERRR